MRGKAVEVIVILGVLVFTQTSFSQTRLLPDYVGSANRFKLLPPFFSGPTNTDPYGLSAAETNALNQIMRSIADFLVAQPAVSPPRGFMTKGNMRITASSLCPKAPCRDTPIAGADDMNFFEYLERNHGKPEVVDESSNWVHVFLNDPVAPTLRIEGTGDAFQEIPGGAVFVQPVSYGAVQGFTVYGGADRGRGDFIVLARSGQPLLVPLPQGIYLPVLIRYWEKEEAKQTAEFQGHNPAADDASYQKWLAGRADRLKQSKAICEMMRKGGDPRTADECLRNVEKTEEETGKSLQLMIATANKSDQAAAPRTSNLLHDTRSVIARLKKQQAEMTPTDRQAQARWDPTMTTSDDPKGSPLFMVNPKVMDRTLPRTAVQLIEVFFYSNQFSQSPDMHTAAARGVFQMEQSSNWPALRQLLAK